MQRFALYTLLLMAVLGLAACGADSETMTATVSAPPPPTDTIAPATTATPLPPTTTAPPAATETPSAAATATLSPILATQQALAAAVRVPTRDTAGGSSETIASDDYVALTDQACRIVQENYVRDHFNGVDWPAKCEEYHSRAEAVESQDAFWDLMSAFIAELGDDHSRFVRPESFAAEFSLPQEGSGRPWIGFNIWPAREEEWLKIWYVCEDGPAADAGLQRGDVILAIDGTLLEAGQDGFDRLEVLQALYAGDKQEVVLTVQQGPDAEPEDVALTYGSAAGCDGWGYGLLGESPRIGYIRVPDFGGDSDANIMTLIEELETEAPLDGLVLDVRHNPGGNSDKDIAIFTTGVFGEVGPLREDATQTTYRIRGPVKWNETTPLAVLTDGASHSAAEYFATAMKQSGRATLVGMPTAGNTEGISGFNLADGSLIRLAVMTLQLPDGSTLEGTGVIPDVEVPLGKWGLHQVPDVQLQAAYDVLAR